MTTVARRVLVTGAASGIGRGTVELLLERGHDVVGLDRDGTVVHVLRELGGTSAVIADVTDAEMVRRAVGEAAHALGGLDGVVNAAGIGGYTGDVAETTPEAWRSVTSVDLDGVFHVCRAAIPHLREAGGGVVVNVSSQFGIVGCIASPAYVAAKAGVIGLTKAMAVDHARRGHPGHVHRPRPGRHPAAQRGYAAGRVRAARARAHGRTATAPRGAPRRSRRSPARSPSCSPRTRPT